MIFNYNTKSSLLKNLEDSTSTDDKDLYSKAIKLIEYILAMSHSIFIFTILNLIFNLSNFNFRRLSIWF